MSLTIEVLGPEPVVRPNPGEGCDYRVPGSIAELREYLRPALLDRQPFGTDWETNSLNTLIARPAGLGVSVSPGTGLYVPVGHLVGSEANLPLHEVVGVLKDADAAGAPSVYYSVGYDHAMMHTAVRWVPQHWHDAIIGVFLVDSNVLTLGLKETSLRLLGKRMEELSDLDAEWVKLSKKAKKETPALLPHQLHPEIVRSYGCADPDHTLQIWHHPKVVQAVKQQSMIYSIEHQLAPVMREGVQYGVYLDNDRLLALEAEATAGINRLIPQILEHLGGEVFALSRKKYLAEKLHALIPGVISERTDGGDFTANVKVLEKYKTAHPVVPLLILYAKLLAQRDMYIIKLRKANEHFALCPWAQGRVRFAFGHIGVPTGRMKCGGAGRGKEAYSKGTADVNGQSIPDFEKAPELPNTRAAFVAPEDYVVVAIDYSQVELRIAGNLAREQRWIDGYKDPKWDIHTSNAQGIADVREPGVTVTNDDKLRRGHAKGTSFALLYGGDATTVARNAGIPVDAAKEIVSAFFATLQGVARWIIEQQNFALANKYVETFMHRIRRLDRYFTNEPPKPVFSDRYEMEADGTYKIDPEGKKVPTPVWAKWIKWAKLRSAGFREAVNHPVQGGAADIFKMACIFIDREVGKRVASGEWAAAILSPQVLWIHDEIVFYVHKDWVTRVVPVLVKAMEFEIQHWPIQLKAEPEVGSTHLYLQNRITKAKDPAVKAALQMQYDTIVGPPTGKNSSWGELVSYDLWVKTYAGSV